MAQLVAHLLCKQGVRGSSPLGSTAGQRPFPLVGKGLYRANTLEEYCSRRAARSWVWSVRPPSRAQRREELGTLAVKVDDGRDVSDRLPLSR